MSLLQRPKNNFVSTVIVPLLIGWIAAGAFGLLIAVLQRNELNGVFPADQIDTQLANRLNTILRYGFLLLFVQSGIVAGLLVWQVYRTAKESPIRYGASAGSMIALVQCLIAIFVLQVPWLFVLLLALLFIGAGIYAGWISTPISSIEGHIPSSA
jgi:hypothetical protein